MRGYSENFSFDYDVIKVVLGISDLIDSFIFYYANFYALIWWTIAIKGHSLLADVVYQQPLKNTTFLIGFLKQRQH